MSSHDGTYAVPSASGPNASGPLAFSLVNTDGQWRISGAPPELLLTPTQFADDYELRNLYFFDPNYHYLVPDPVYVPLQASASTLTTRLVAYLDKQPQDWLAYGATQTAFPASAKVSATLSNNLATVTLTGKFSKTELTQMASQLLWTLVGSGAGGAQVDSLAMIVNGKQYFPAGNAANPVQNKSQASYGPAASASATGASPEFYYADSAGTSTAATEWARPPSRRSSSSSAPGTRRSRSPRTASTWPPCAAARCSLARSQARLRAAGRGDATLSWDPTDNLWATTGNSDEIFVFRTGATAGTRQARPILVNVTSDYGTPTGQQYTALQIAPDGVRVAMITDNDELAFGAIDWEAGPVPPSGGQDLPLAVLRQQPHQRIQRRDVVRAGQRDHARRTGVHPDRVPGERRHADLADARPGGEHHHRRDLGRAADRRDRQERHDRSSDPDRRLDVDRDWQWRSGKGQLTHLPRLNRQRTSRAKRHAVWPM